MIGKNMVQLQDCLTAYLLHLVPGTAERIFLLGYTVSEKQIFNVNTPINLEQEFFLAYFSPFNICTYITLCAVWRTLLLSFHCEMKCCSLISLLYTVVLERERTSMDLLSLSHLTAGKIPDIRSDRHWSKWTNCTSTCTLLNYSIQWAVKGRLQCSVVQQLGSSMDLLSPCWEDPRHEVWSKWTQSTSIYWQKHIRKQSQK